jgi:hypothetical protein
MGNRSSALRVFLYLTVIVVLFSAGLVAQAELVSSQELVNQRNAHTRVHEFVHRVPALDPVTGLPSENEIIETTRTVVEKGTDINYRDDEGSWQKTDTAFSLSNVEGYTYTALKQRAKIRFAPLGGFNVEYEIGGGSVLLGVRAIGYFDRSSGQRRLLANVSNVSPQCQDNRLIYANAFPGADIEYVNENTEFKQNVILKDKERLPDPASYGMSATSTYLVVVTEIDISESDKRLWADGINLESVAAMETKHFSFKDYDGRTVHYLAHGNAWDSSSEQMICKVYKRVIRENGRLFLLEGLPYEQIMAMTFPVTIDYIQKTSGSTGNEVWDRGKTWWVSSIYNINSGDTLVIEPGTVIKIGSSSAGYTEKLNVLSGGVVKAVGEPYNPIFLTSWADDGCGEDLDTGADDLPSETTPAPQDYTSAFYFDGGSNDSEIQFCRIRYAKYAVFSINTQLNNAIRDNILYQCSRGIHQQISTATTSSANYINNLISDCSFPIVIDNETGNAYSMTANLYNNTIDGAYLYGVYCHCLNGYINLSMTAQNNIVTNTNYGFYDGASNVSHDSGIVSNNGFSNINNANYYGGISGATTLDLNTTNPYESSSNGDYYLDQSTSFQDGGTGSLTTLELDDKTTIEPNQVLVSSSISSDATWSKVSCDTGDIDLGYHHPRVDYLVGDNATSGDYRVNVGAHLTVEAGVVGSFYRSPDLSCYPQLYFTGATQEITAVGTPSEYILLDSAYYLGTNFFNNRGSFNDCYHAYGFFFNSINNDVYPEFSFCKFRHLFAIQVYQNDHKTPIENNIFDQCYFSTVIWHPRGTSSSNRATFRNNLCMNAYYSGFYAAGDSEVMHIEASNNTLVNCERGIYIKSSGNYHDVTVYAERNVIINNETFGIGGSSSGSSAKQKLDLETPDTNIYWNNGIDVDDTYLTVSGTVADPTSPLPATLSSATEELDSAGFYISQVSSDASIIPFEVLDGCFDVDDPLENLTNWPTGTWEVEIYGLDDINQWEDSPYPDPMLEACLSGETLEVDEPMSANSGNMLIVITNSISGGDPTSTPYFDAVFDNGSRIRMYFSIADLTGIGVGESLAFWVALDGSTYYARANQTSTSTTNDQVDQNSDYAMREDVDGLAQGAKAGGAADSPAIDIAGTGYFSEGYTSTVGGVDYYPIDAGFHYGGSIEEDDTAPSDSDLTVTEDSLYLYANTSASFFYNNQSGESFILNATMGTETNPWQLTWAAAFATPLLTESDSAPNTRAYAIDSSTSTGSVSTIFRDKAGNEETETVTCTYDGTAPACTVATATGAVLSGTQTISGTATDDGGSGVRGAAFYWDLNDNGQADPMEKLGDAEESGGSWQLSWVTANLFNGYHRLIIVAEDNVSNTNTDTDQYVFVANGNDPAMISPSNDKVFYFASDCTDVSFEVTFVSTSSSTIEDLRYQVNSYSGSWTAICENESESPITRTCTVNSTTFAGLDTGLHIVYLKAEDVEDQAVSGTNGEWKVYIFKKPPGTSGNPPDGGCSCTDPY